MSKIKENGCSDYGKIELIEPSDAIMAEADSAELELGQEIFCAGWPAVLKYLQKLRTKIKNPIFRGLCGIGLSIIDGLHEATCKVG